MRHIGSCLLVLAIALVALIAPGGAMHDRHGNGIEVGDVVSGLGGQYPIVGPVVATVPGSETCNVRVLMANLPGYSPAVSEISMTAKECEIVYTGHGRMLTHGPYAGYRSEGEHRFAVATQQRASTSTPAPV